MKTVEYKDVPLVEYQGPKKPMMPTKCSIQKVQSLRVLAMAAVASNIAKSKDFQFFKAIIEEPDTPEFGGFNSKLLRNAGFFPEPKTTCMYTPLIDKTPADPSTVLTTLTEAIRLTENTGQGGIFLILLLKFHPFSPK